jgi:hypothetical protein
MSYNCYSDIMDKVIFYIHLILYIAAIITPFVAPKEILQMYSLTIPFLFLHWSLNDDTCVLTTLEQYMTGNEKHETFTGKLMKDIYTMPDNEYGKISKTLFFTLWLITQYRLGHIDFLFSFYPPRKQHQ